MRKNLSLLLAFCMILSMFTGLNMLSASAAAGDYKINLEMPGNIPEVGATFRSKVNVEIAAGLALSGAGFTISYPAEFTVENIHANNTDKLVYPPVSSDVNDYGFAQVDPIAHTITFALTYFDMTAMSVNPITNSGTLASVIFKVANAVTGNATISLSDVDMADGIGNTVSAADIDDSDDTAVMLPTIPAGTTGDADSIQFDFTLNDPAKFPSLFSITPLSEAKYLERGKEYTTNVYLSDMSGIDSFTLPMEFDTDVIEIVNLDLGAAWQNTTDYKLLPIYSSAGSQAGKAAAAYEAGNASLKLTENVNKTGAFILTFESADGSDINIGGISNPIDPAKNHFFTITYRVKDDAPYDAPTGLGATGKLAGITTYDWLSRIDGSSIHAIAHNVMNAVGDDMGTRHYAVSLGADQPVVLQKEINIIAPVTNENNYDMPSTEAMKVLTAEVIGTKFDAIIGNDLVWSVIDPTGNTTRTDTVLSGHTTGSATARTPEFRPEMSGVYKIYVDSANPDYQGSGTWITITVEGGAAIYGQAMLSGKYRGTTSVYGYSSRGAALDAGIKVELVEGTQGVGLGEIVKGVYTYTTGTVAQENSLNYNFILPIPEVIVDEITKPVPTKEYYLRFTRIGVPENATSGREESYLLAELVIDSTSAIARNAKVSISTPIYLSAGAFSAPSVTKNEITSLDVNTIKNLVGADTDNLTPDAEAISEMFNINEYANVDAGDLANVRRFQGNTKNVGSVKFNGSNIGTVTP